VKTPSLLSILLLTLFLLGCGTLPLRPGKSAFRGPSGLSGELTQSQNPQQESRQTYKRTVEIDSGNSISTPPRVISETIETTIGAAQKDTAREIGAKLSALKGVVWVGVLVFLFGAASFVYPPLKLLVGGSVTTSAVIAVAGLSMIVLPSLLVGNELLILSVAVGAAVLYWFSHRHGKLQGFVDLNQNGLDDRRE